MKGREHRRVRVVNQDGRTVFDRLWDTGDRRLNFASGFGYLTLPLDPGHEVREGWDRDGEVDDG